MFIFSSVSIIFASIGIVLAATSFISGLQLVKGKGMIASIDLKIHRANGYFTIVLFAMLAMMAIPKSAVDAAALQWPVAGMSIFMLKFWIVRKKRRLHKYVSWLGGTLLLVWLFIFYVNIPV